jgi:RNA polymerase sigma-70 factor (ECF subfamily)
VNENSTVADSRRDAQSLTDEALAMAFKMGDERCFDALFDRYKSPMVNFAYRFVRRQDVAEELAQEIFVKVYQHARSFEPRALFRTWLYRIARNHCLNEVRRQSYKTTTIEVDHERMVSDAASADQILQARATQTLVLAALDKMPENQRTAFQLSRTHNLSYDEIADSMETTVSAVKSLLNRAKRHMVEELKDVLTREVTG